MFIWCLWAQNQRLDQLSREFAYPLMGTFLTAASFYTLVPFNLWGLTSSPLSCAPIIFVVIHLRAVFARNHPSICFLCWLLNCELNILLTLWTWATHYPLGLIAICHKFFVLFFLYIFHFSISTEYCAFTCAGLHLCTIEAVFHPPFCELKLVAILMAGCPFCRPIASNWLASHVPMRLAGQLVSMSFFWCALYIGEID